MTKLPIRLNLIDLIKTETGQKNCIGTAFYLAGFLSEECYIHPDNSRQILETNFQEDLIYRKNNIISWEKPVSDSETKIIHLGVIKKITPELKIISREGIHEYNCKEKITERTLEYINRIYPNTINRLYKLKK